MSMGQIPPGAPARHNEYFIDRDGIDREVITADICRYLGHDALVRTGVYEDPVTKQNRPGYYITAYRNLTSAMIEDLKNDSARWEQERANHAARNTRVVASPVDGNHYYGGNPINNNHNGNNISISDRPMQRSGSPGKPALVPPPPPPASQSQPSPPGGYPPHNSHNGYAPRQDMPVSNVPPASHDYPAPRYTPHQPPYPGSVPPHPAGGYSHPPPQTSAPYNQNHGGHTGHSGTPEQQYPGSYPTPTSMPSYSAPPTQAPYGGPPPPMPEYSSQQPYISTGSNLQPKFDRHGAAAPPPQNGYAAGQPPSYPPGQNGYPYPPPQPPTQNGSMHPHFDAPSPQMDSMYNRNGYQDRSNASPVNQGPSLGGPPGIDRQIPVPTKSPQNYPPHSGPPRSAPPQSGPYGDIRGPYHH